jgi:hypothetical protein
MKFFNKVCAAPSLRRLRLVPLLILAGMLALQPVQAKHTQKKHPPKQHAPKKIKAPTVSCPAAASLQSLLALGSIYFGETHGTVESPYLVGCVVDAEVAAKTAPLTVAVELPAAARDLDNPYWTHADGRSSGAMNSLVAHLETLEQQGKLKLDFLLPSPLPADAALNRQLGEHLRDLAAAGRVIALTGNAISPRKQVGTSTAAMPAGAFVGARIKTVMIVSARDGNGWNCTTECSVHKIKGITGAKEGTLVSGSAYGHDYLYVLGTFTASPPAHAG